MLMSAAFLVSALVQFALGLIVAALLGPAEFGLYALAFAASVIGQTVGFEAVRLALTRFSGADPTLLTRLKRPLLGLVAFVAVLGFAGAFVFPERGLLLGLVALGAVTLGLADIRAALMRAEFAERQYATFLLARTVASLLLVPAASWVMPRADVALGALLASVWMAMAFVSRRKAASKTEASTSVEPIQLANAMRYAAPIVLTNLAYLALFFGLRAFVAANAGLARSGQFSLALELGLKLVMTLGTALDLYLFQLAVRARDQHGEAAGLAELERNARLIFALLAPTVLGLWLVLPSLETLLVAPAYRGVFGSDLTGLLPALLLYASIQYIFHPAFQLSTRTSMIGAASALVVVVAAIGWGAGRFMGFGAVPVAAGALSFGLAVGLSWLAHGAHLGAAFRWPHVARLALALAGLAMVVLPLRQGWAPGLLNLVASAALGAAAFTIIAFIVNLGDIRSQWRVFRKPGGG